MTDHTTEPVCKFEEGCHRVVACDPGCGAPLQADPVPDRITLNRSDLAALLAHHADVIAARWRAVAPGAGAWEVAAALSLTEHGHALTGEKETPAVTELLDSILSFPVPPTNAAAPAVLPAPADRAAVRTPAEPFPIWTVWREEQPAYGYFATEDIAKRASIDCWEEDESACPDYSWRPDGGPGNWGLLVGGERAEVYIRRHLVWGGLPQPPRAAVLTEAADEAERVAESLRAHHEFERSTGALDVMAELRRLAGEAAPNTEAGQDCAHCGKPVRRITGTLAVWWVHVPGGIAMCHPRQGEASPRATPSGEVAPDNTETRVCCGCPSEDAVEHQFGGKDCDCVPFTRQEGSRVTAGRTTRST